VPDLGLEEAGDPLRAGVKGKGTGDVEKGLVDGEDLHKGGELLHHLDDPGGGVRVLPVVADHEDELGAFLAAPARQSSRS